MARALCRFAEIRRELLWSADARRYLLLRWIQIQAKMPIPERSIYQNRNDGAVAFIEEWGEHFRLKHLHRSGF